MQTFLCEPDFAETAKCLDYRRLGKQRVEAKQILEINLFRADNGFSWIYCVNCGRIYYLPGQPNFNCPYCGSNDTTGRGKTNFIKIPWENHPAVLMWRGYEASLALYGWNICEEWKRRGYRDSLQEFFTSIISGLASWNLPNPHIDINYFPPWYKDSLEIYKLVQSHRSNLLRKDYNYYSKFNWNDVDDTLPYYWPVKKG